MKMTKNASVLIRINSDIKEIIFAMDLSAQKIVDEWIEKNIEIVANIKPKKLGSKK